jgi:hypothetical protein
MLMYVHMTVVHIWIESPYIIFVLFLYKIFFFRKKYQKYQILILKFVYCSDSDILQIDGISILKVNTSKLKKTNQ